MTLIEAAMRLDTAGLSVVPAKQDGSKRPFGLWKSYQQTRPTQDDLAGWFNNGCEGLGVITGAVSGQLEMFEAEGRAVDEGIVEQLGQALADNGFDNLWLRICTGYVERTPSGGMHWYYRISDGVADRNLKLARRPATAQEMAEKPDDRVKVLLETRGEGGFSIVAPSTGPTHPSGLPWVAIVGTPETIPTITAGERDALHAIATSLDRMPVVDLQPADRAPRRVGDGLRPGDDYNQRTDWADILKPHGWRLVARFSGTTLGWCRPGKTGDGVSATTGRNDGDNLYVFSSSTVFDTEKPYSKFAAYTLLEHGGDYHAAAKALAVAGYGDPPTEIPGVTTIETVDGEDLDDTVRRLFPRIDWHALWADQDEEEWIVEPLLPARRLIALYSAPKVGKSLLMLELAASIATGSSALGVTPDRPRRVLYIDFENDPKADIRERLQAMAYKPDDLERLDYLSFPTLAALDSERGGAELMEAIRVYRSEVVVVDTVSRAVKGEENENDTWLAFYRHTGLQLKQKGIALVRLDHSGKDESKGQRGGSAKMGDVDAVWRLSRVTDDVYRLDCEANRMPVNERTLTLHREQLPRLHHRVDAKGRSAAYEALIAKYIETLDHLGVDKNLGRDKVRTLLQEAGHAAKNAPLGEAIKRRKMSVLSVPATAGTGPSEHLSPDLRGQVGTGSDDD